MHAESMRDMFVRVATDLLDTDQRLAIVLSDISADRFLASGAFARHPRRVLNVGIREQLMVNVASGMALEGFRPIVHSYAPFLVERAFEQVKLGFSHQGTGAVLVSVGASYDWAEGGRTHQAPADVSLIASLPGWRIHVPGHRDEAELFIRDAMGVEDPVYIRLSDQTNRECIASPAGQLVVCRRGRPGSATVIAVGPMLDTVMEAVADMDLTVAYAATVRPFDGSGLRAAAAGPDVILVEPYLEGTSAAEISSALMDRRHRLLSIGVPNVEHRRYGRPSEHARAHGLDADGLRRRIDAWVNSADSGESSV